MDNSIKTVAHNTKLQMWAERVQECRSSGLPVKIWCKEHGIKLSTFYTWQKKVFCSVSTEVQASTSVAAPVFAEIFQALPVKTASANVAATLNVGRLSIDLYDNASSEFIESILRGLRSC